MTKEITTPTVKALTQMVDYQEGSVVSRIVLKQEKGNITLFAFDQDQSLSEHTAPFSAFVLIVDGQAEVKIEGELYKLKTGENIILPANRPHSLRAPERFKMLLVMIRE